MLNLIRFTNKIPRVFTAGLSTTLPLEKGHSKWQNIRETKGKNDSIRSQKISFFLRKIKTAIKNDGFDPKFNKNLEKLQTEYKSQSLPIDTLNKYLVRLKEKPDITCFYDLIGPSGSFIIVEAETDNYNRTKNTVQKYIKKAGGVRLSASSLRNRFDEKGFIIVAPTKTDGSKVVLETLEEVGIELDCEDVSKLEDRDEGPVIEMTVDATKLNKVEAQLVEHGYNVENSEVRLIAHHFVSLSAEESASLEKLYELLGEDEDVTQIHDNIEGDEAQQQATT